MPCHAISAQAALGSEENNPGPAGRIRTAIDITAALQGDGFCDEPAQECDMPAFSGDRQW